MRRAFRVSRLIYRFESLNELDRFTDAAPWWGRLGDFDVALIAGTLTATPRVLLTSAPQARVALEPHLWAWEIKSLLRPVPHHIRFVLEKVEFAAVARAAGGQSELTLRPIERPGQFTADAAIAREYAAYPEPDPSFSATPVVEGLSHWIACCWGTAISSWTPIACSQGSKRSSGEERRTVAGTARRRWASSSRCCTRSAN